MTTFTRGGHGHGEMDALAQMGSPQQAGMDEGARMATGGMAQHPEMMAAAGIKHLPQEQSQNPQLLEAQRALGSNISDGLQRAEAVSADLTTKASIPRLGTDSVS